MQRYFVQNYKDNLFYIQGDDWHHIVHVMRYKKGDQIICQSPQGKSALCLIEDITAQQVVASVVKWEEGSSELPVKVAIASGLPKGDKLEWIIQKGTELGASLFVPFIAARSIVKWDERKSAKKLERWQKIAKEAAEQSHRQILPQIFCPVSLQKLIEIGEKFDYKLIAFEEAAKEGEKSVLVNCLQNIKEGQSLLIVFGPEGGLTSEEVAFLTNHGFQSCGLGPRILRTETAPLYALAAISYHTELMR